MCIRSLLTLTCNLTNLNLLEETYTLDTKQALNLNLNLNLNPKQWNRCLLEEPLGPAHILGDLIQPFVNPRFGFFVFFGPAHMLNPRFRF
jgi:hypothetical protein